MRDEGDGVDRFSNRRHSDDTVPEAIVDISGSLSCTPARYCPRAVDEAGISPLPSKYGLVSRNNGGGRKLAEVIVWSTNLLVNLQAKRGPTRGGRPRGSALYMGYSARFSNLHQEISNASAMTAHTHMQHQRTHRHEFCSRIFDF